MSKPKKPGTAFHKRWCTGTRSVYLVPCLHCGTHQELTFFGKSATEYLKPVPKTGEAEAPWPKALRCGRVRFEHCKDLTKEWDRERLLRETYYECVNGCRINADDVLPASVLDDPIISGSLSEEVRAMLRAGETVTHKRAMVLSGHWLATNPNPHPRRRSRHISDLYSLYDDLSWSELALLWIDSQGDSEKLQHFFNNNLGLVFRVKASTINEALVLELRADYGRGECPFVPDFLSLNFDTQQHYYAAVIMAFLVDGTAAIVDWFDAIADEDIVRRFERPINLSSRLVHPQAEFVDPTTRPKDVTPQLGLGDAAGAKGRTGDVYDLCMKLPGRLYPSFGRGGLQITTPISERRVPWRMTTIPIILFSDDTFKRKLYVDRISRIKEIKAAQAEGKDPVLFNLPPRLYAPRDMDGKLAQELSNERQKPDLSWEDPAPGPNHLGDAVKNGFVQFEFLLPRLLAEKARAAADKAKAEKSPQT